MLPRELAGIAFSLGFLVSPDEVETYLKGANVTLAEIDVSAYMKSLKLQTRSLMIILSKYFPGGDFELKVLSFGEYLVMVAFCKLRLFS